MHVNSVNNHTAKDCDAKTEKIKIRTAMGTIIVIIIPSSNPPLSQQCNGKGKCLIKASFEKI